MGKRYLYVAVVLIASYATLVIADHTWSEGADINDDSIVNYKDFAIMAKHWLKKDPFWVYINDPGVEGHEGFTGHMCRYETTNAQYCQFLNDAAYTGDITVFIDTNSAVVYGADGINPGADFVDHVYYDLAGEGFSHDGAIDGGASRITYTGGGFYVDTGFGNHPVSHVSWYGATAYCNYYGYRLPSEWQWQGVADYDGSYIYGCGLTINNDIANYAGSTHPFGCSDVGSFGDPCGYGYGMFDMAGNIWEWTNSGIYRTLRGGGWLYQAEYNTVAYRINHNPADTNFLIGFRVCRTIEPDGMVWMYINDPGVDGHEGFIGYMSKYETTNAQYCQFLNAALASGDISVDANNIVYGATGTNSGADFAGQVYLYTYPYLSFSQIIYSDGTFSVRSRDGYDMSSHPVVEVSWYGATAFCNYYGYRLPTQWEWQAVADYDGSYTYGCGVDINQSKANYYDDKPANPLDLSSYPLTTPVNYYPSYGYEMNDMAGNVWEWTNTVFSSVILMPRGLRGGSWSSYESSCTVSKCNNDYPHNTSCYYGFRACR